MDLDARRRLKAELANKGITAKDLSARLGYASTYISRLMAGEIREPSAKRVQEIEAETGIDWAYILTGSAMTPQKRKLLDDIANAPEGVIEDVARFVREHGLDQD